MREHMRTLERTRDARVTTSSFGIHYAAVLRRFRERVARAGCTRPRTSCRSRWVPLSEPLTILAARDLHGGGDTLFSQPAADVSHDRMHHAVMATRAWGWTERRSVLLARFVVADAGFLQSGTSTGRSRTWEE
jgi:non-ribosomal peptide synthetase component F